MYTSPSGESVSWKNCARVPVPYSSVPKHKGNSFPSALSDMLSTSNFSVQSHSDRTNFAPFSDNARVLNLLRYVACKSFSDM